MNCTECQEKMVELFEDLLPDSHKQIMEEHLSNCPYCLGQLQELKTLSERLTANSAAWQRTEMEDEVTNRIIRLQSEKLKQADKVKYQLRKWRLIMNSRITKYVAAAVIILAVVIGINLSGGKVGVTTIAFAEIAEAMKNVPWMYQGQIEKGIDGKTEQWYGFEAKIFASKPAIGKPMFFNLKEKKSYTYNSKKKTITIENINNFPLDLSSPMTLLDSLVKNLQGDGAKIDVKEIEVNGQKVQLQEITKFEADKNKT